MKSIGISTLRIALTISMLFVILKGWTQSGTETKPPFLQTTGQIDYSYLNGYTWQYTNTEFPSSIHSTSGDIGLTFSQLLPIKVNWMFVDQPYLNGSPNRFSVSLDTEAMKELLLQQRSLEEHTNILNKVDIRNSLDSVLGLRAFQKIKLSELEGKLDGLEPPDTTGLSVPEYQHLLPEHQHLTDSLTNVINEYQQSIEALSVQSDELVEQLEWANDLTKVGMPDIPEEKIRNNGFFKVLEQIRKFDLGTFQPSRSILHTQGVPMRGGQLELGSDKYYVLVAHGKTVERFKRPYRSNSTNGGLLEDFNFFNNLPGSPPGKMSLYRVGWGAPRTSHVHVGVLHGKRSLADTSGQLPDFDERNVAAHVDVKYELDRHRSISASYARSYTWVGRSDAESGRDTSSVMDHLFKDKGNDALQIAMDLRFPKSRTNFRAEGLKVGDLYNSMGVAFLRRSQQRLSGVLSQGIGRKFNVKVRYRGVNYEPEGSASEVMMQMVNTRLKYKLGKKTTLMLLGSFADQTVKNEALPAATTTMTSVGTDIIHRWRKRDDQFVLTVGYGSNWMTIPDRTTRTDQLRSNFTWTINGKGTVNASIITNALPDTARSSLATVRAQASLGSEIAISEKFRLSGLFTVYDMEGLELALSLGMGWKIFKGIGWELNCSVPVKGEIYDQSQVPVDQNFIYTCRSRLFYRW